jgi:LysR family transcriptional regulator, glycine cleavage system transcriptional activator
MSILRVGADHSRMRLIRKDLCIMAAMSYDHCMSRRLPPLNAIRVFEAASRNASFTAAAAELAVTQGAVSRHVAALEAWLGIKLFARNLRGIALTPKGVVYARIVRSALDQLDYGTRQLKDEPDQRLLRLKVPPTFAIRWLAPRLAQFHARNRNLELQITTSHHAVDFNREDVDACIHSGTAPLPDAHCHRLFGEVVLPVCCPALLARDPPLVTPRDLARHVLISSLHRPRDWPTWSAAAGIADVDGNNGIRVENSALAYQAAIDGLGVAIAQRSFVDDDLRNGRLVAPFTLQVPADGSYYFAYPEGRPKPPRVGAFEDWIIREAIAMEQALGARAPEPLRIAAVLDAVRAAGPAARIDGA